METVYDLKNHCYGCGACKNICPTIAIHMEEDEEGFLYPNVNKSKCIDCGRCQAVCPIDKLDNQSGDYGQEIYGIKHKKEGIRMTSSSGGMFTAISDYILERGGTVYGAAYDDSLNICHQRALTSEARDRMRGSKYVQSNMGEVHKLIRSDLKEGKQVLFTGTPCQADGLKYYLGDLDTSGLILCDLVCHGVPSNLMWKEYKQLINKRKGELKTHYFRTKEYGWHNMRSMNVLMNGKEDDKSILSQVHMSLFLTNLLLRPCCYTCKYSSFRRVADITIADFWGVERSMKEFDDNKGISLVLINSQKGKELFLSVENKLLFRESESSLCRQRNLEQPTGKPVLREDFWKDYYEHGYEYIAKKYVGCTLKNQLKESIHNGLKALLLKIPNKHD